MKKILLMFSLVLTLLCSVLLISNKDVGAYTPQVGVESSNYYRFISFNKDSVFADFIDDNINTSYIYSYLVCFNDNVDGIWYVPLICYSIGDDYDTYRYNYYFSIYSYQLMLSDPNIEFYIYLSIDVPVVPGTVYADTGQDGLTDVTYIHKYITTAYSFSDFNRYDFIYIDVDSLTGYPTGNYNSYYDFPLNYGTLPLELSQQFSYYMNNNIWVNNAYNEGYYFGYDRGKYDGEIAGKNEGLIEGQLLGYDLGFDEGRSIGLGEGRAEGDMWFGVGLLSLVDIPFNIFRDIFNFTIFGFNIYNLIFALLTLGVVIWLLKKLIFNRS